MKKILLVEDEETLIRMYEEKFERAGFKVKVARTAEEGIEMIMGERPDLVILDIILPNKNGIYFLEKIREDKSLNDLPIIVFSNYDNPEAEKAVKKLGVDDYIIKANHDPEEIIKAIEEKLS